MTQLDDVVWDAIQPALLLASQVLESEHPYWNAVMSIYHFKPVPDDRDPRQPARQGPGIGNYNSVWLEQVPDNEMVCARYNAITVLGCLLDLVSKL